MLLFRPLIAPAAHLGMLSSSLFLKYHAKCNVNIRKALSMSITYLAYYSAVNCCYYEMSVRAVIQKETLAKLLLNAMLCVLFRE